jgi:hypothetical protein
MVSGKHEYLVKDKHKWFLSKIKYGVWFDEEINRIK